jgi:hypothetical protein
VTARLLLFTVVLVPLVPWTQARLDEHAGRYRAQEEVLYLWSGAQVKRLFPGFESVAADIYWLRTVQYFGGERLFAREKRFELLRPLIEITTTLDPRLEIAYRYGAVFLCEPAPVGAGRPQEGIAVLEKGVRNLPNSWRLRQDLGFFLYLFLDEPQRAATILNEAARIEGAPFWLRTLAASVESRGGDRAKARRMWQEMFEQAEPGVLKENARLQLRILDSEDVADRLTALVAEAAKREGRRPARLTQLRAEGLWRGPLEDAAGVPFSYDRETGRVSVSRKSPLWRPQRILGGRHVSTLDGR